jgi:DNA polymerase-3 subunit gamma/tau
MCTGALEGDLLTVYAPDDITLGRLENDRVKTPFAKRPKRPQGQPYG